MGAKLSFISIQISIRFDDQFFLIYLKTKLLRINLKEEHCGLKVRERTDLTNGDDLDCILDSIICLLDLFVLTRFSSKHQSFC
jgi:hypothetical protein